MSEQVTPVSHAISAADLSPSALVYLFQIALADGTAIRLVNGPLTHWGGQRFEAAACQLTGVQSSIDEKTARPRFTVQNPEGLFSEVVSQGSFEGARLTRYRVLRSDLEAGNSVHVAQSWRIARIPRLNKQIIEAELRNMLDRKNFVIPSHTYSPPDFPVVRLR